MNCAPIPFDIEGLQCLRQWKKVFIRQTFDAIEPGLHEDELYYECSIKRAKGCSFIRCCFTGSKLDFASVEDMQDLVMGMDCANFSRVELSPMAFDYMALLLVRQKGNTEKRAAIIEALGGKDYVRGLLNAQYEGNSWWNR
jgi:hypothetical protein